jgi:hypothetical protein
MIVDSLTVEVKSNGKNTLSEASCDFSGVSINENSKIQGSREYNVAAPYTKTFDISTYLDGVDALTPEFCQDEIHMSLSMQKSNGRWVELWNDENDYYWSDYSNNWRIESEGVFY